MINYKTGNLLESEAEALVNTVNTVGVMGKGIALQFKNRFPNNFKIYAKACKDQSLTVGKLLVTEESSLLSGKKLIVNFPTKTNWRLPSEYQYIEDGLRELARFIVERGIKSIAIPPLGAGNGGLEWIKVKTLIEKHLNDLDCDIQVYEPGKDIQEALKKERVKLTPARAMRSEEHTSELQSRPHLVCRLLLEKKKRQQAVPPCVRELVAAHGRGRYEGPAGVRFVLVDGIAAGLGERKRRGRRIELRVRLARLA